MSLSFPEYIRGLEQKIANLQVLEQEAGRAFADAHRQHMNSIFGGMEGTSYSTKPMLRGSYVQGATPPANKFGRQNESFITTKGRDTYFGSKERIKAQQWKTVQTPKGPRRLIVLQGGYAEFRRVQGRQTEKVDLRLKGILERDYRSSFAITEDGAISGLSREENFKKWEGQSERYGEKVLVSQSIIDQLLERLAANYVKFQAL